jgi:hypothetical protein
MPIIAPGAKVLVTGANGFIAAWVISALLDMGFAVRGTVRTEVKGVHLKELFKAHGERFEIGLVHDNLEVSADRVGANRRVSNDDRMAPMMRRSRAWMLLRIWHLLSPLLQPEEIHKVCNDPSTTVSWMWAQSRDRS